VNCMNTNNLEKKCFLKPVRGILFKNQSEMRTW
jgi:hypothetical protein